MATNSPTRVPEAEMNGIYGGLLKRVIRKRLGEVPESVGVAWNQPAVFKAMMGFGRKVEKWDRLDPNLASLATMATAAYVGCSFCLDLHYFERHNHGLDMSKARDVPRWRESDAFTAVERRVMEYAEAMSETPLAVTDAMSAELLERLGAPALVELTARVATMNLMARTNVALGIHSHGLSASCGLPPLATRSPEVVGAA